MCIFINKSNEFTKIGGGIFFLLLYFSFQQQQQQCPTLTLSLSKITLFLTKKVILCTLMVLPVSVQSMYLLPLYFFQSVSNLFFFSSASVLGSVMYKVAILATLRSKKLNGSTIGVMITASHNPEEVNI